MYLTISSSRRSYNISYQTEFRELNNIPLRGIKLWYGRRFIVSMLPLDNGLWPISAEQKQNVAIGNRATSFSGSLLLYLTGLDT